MQKNKMKESKAVAGIKKEHEKKTDKEKMIKSLKQFSKLILSERVDIKRAEERIEKFQSSVDDLLKEHSAYPTIRAFLDFFTMVRNGLENAALKLNYAPEKKDQSFISDVCSFISLCNKTPTLEEIRSSHPDKLQHEMCDILFSQISLEELVEFVSNIKFYDFHSGLPPFVRFSRNNALFDIKGPEGLTESFSIHQTRFVTNSAQNFDGVDKEDIRACFIITNYE